MGLKFRGLIKNTTNFNFRGFNFFVGAVTADRLDTLCHAVLSVAMVEWTFSSVVRGYHIYKDTWDAVIGEHLPCRRETSNRHDPFAVAIVKENNVVGHVPRKMSATCSLFLRKSGLMSCRITGSRQYSQDLPQGGLELPCVYIFTGELMLIEKLKKLIMMNRHSTDEKLNKTVKGEVQHQDDNSIVQPAGKRRKIDESASHVWVSVDNESLTAADKSWILDKSRELNDQHVFVAQRLLLRQFSSFRGLNSTLVYECFDCWVDNYIQIMFCRGNHWMLVTTIGCSIGEVYVYDSLYCDVDDETKQKVKNIFHCPSMTFVVPRVKHQKGIKDCALFAIAFTTLLLHGATSETLVTHQFVQDQLRLHLVKCLEERQFTQFPCIES